MMAELSSIIKSVVTVAPDEPTWKGILPLSVFDQAAGFTYVPYIYFYHPTLHNNNDVVSTLKDSLSRCLTHFYPMAGRIRRAGAQMELHCNAAGAVLVEAETATKMAEVVVDDHEQLAMSSEKYKHLSYAVDYTKPTHELALLYAQVTWFSCGGFSLGISISHAVTDGLGGHHLISEWTRIARGEGLERSPYLKRDVLGARGQAPSTTRLEEEQRRVAEVADSRRPVRRELGVVNLRLTNNQVEALKAAAHDDDGELTKLQRPYTRFQVLTAHIWRCICKARGQDGAQATAIAFSVDSRTRLSPPLPPNFFGNSVLPVGAKAPADDLISNPLGFGCSRVRSSIENATSDYIWSDIEKLRLINDFRTMPGIRVPGEGGSSSTVIMPELLVVSWLRLPLYGRDFGWGEETHMGAGPQTTEGNTIIFPGRGEDGSVVIAMCLDMVHAQKFKHHFLNF